MFTLSDKQILITAIIYWTVLVFQEKCPAASPVPVPANFVFGDSLVDVGNNNYIVSLSKADYIPNGIDFGGPTGRCTNGRTIIDIIGLFCFCSAVPSFYLTESNLLMCMCFFTRSGIGFPGIYSSLLGSIYNRSRDFAGC